VVFPSEREKREECQFGLGEKGEITGARKGEERLREKERSSLSYASEKEEKREKGEEKSQVLSRLWEKRGELNFHSRKGKGTYP